MVLAVVRAGLARREVDGGVGGVEQVGVRVELVGIHDDVVHAGGGPDGVLDGYDAEVLLGELLQVLALLIDGQAGRHLERALGGVHHHLDSATASVAAPPGAVPDDPAPARDVAEVFAVHSVQAQGGAGVGAAGVDQDVRLLRGPGGRDVASVAGAAVLVAAPDAAGLLADLALDGRGGDGRFVGFGLEGLDGLGVDGVHDGLLRPPQVGELAGEADDGVVALAGLDLLLGQERRGWGGLAGAEDRQELGGQWLGGRVPRDAAGELVGDGLAGHVAHAAGADDPQAAVD